MTNNTATTQSVAAPLGAPVEDLKRVKQGHSFLGCLCDMRRAVIMINILGVGLGIAGLLTVILVDKYGDKEEQKVFLNGYDIWALIAIQAAVCVGHFSGLMGAVNFSICPVTITILMEIAYAVLSGLDQNWIGLGVSIFFIYPHVFLCYELAKGIMTPENYFRQERQSCCCV
ncbi:expressed unknown protein [Seminavis robusta]|uniref:Uncharacterized protein n=1 Tax=Seminavis robusta TaxID=568900 RepID=A0A9N8DN86_9STRA|nr:expressed unknown protein [Seminavis robusta]|eukprot:Sro172_g076010.1 n/a (172) ;mRNA; f:55560-56075